MHLVDVAEFRTILSRESNVVALCGAGISMFAPTSLPSGNQLRDICVRELLQDDLSDHLVNRLLRSPAYQALLPEAVLQEIGYFAQTEVDRLIARTL